jgi:hypothetical protein
MVAAQTEPGVNRRLKALHSLLTLLSCRACLPRSQLRRGRNWVHGSLAGSPVARTCLCLRWVPAAGPAAQLAQQHPAQSGEELQGRDEERADNMETVAAGGQLWSACQAPT